MYLFTVIYIQYLNVVKIGLEIFKFAEKYETYYREII